MADNLDGELPRDVAGWSGVFGGDDVSPELTRSMALTGGLESHRFGQRGRTIREEPRPALVAAGDRFASIGGERERPARRVPGTSWPRRIETGETCGSTRFVNPSMRR